MLFGNFQLLVFGVARQTDDLHTVHQGPGNVQRIGGGDKHHAGEIIIHFEIVIAKGGVLFRIKNFQQRR